MELALVAYILILRAGYKSNRFMKHAMPKVVEGFIYSKIQQLSQDINELFRG